MRYALALAVTGFLFASPAVYADEVETTDSTENPPATEATEGLQPFTGQINRNRVRLRVKPHLGSPIVQELNQGNLLVVLGEDEDFYAVLPSEETKGYVYRTYILDGAIEGTHVNVRLAPTLEAPVIAQMNTGDKVEGSISTENPKWMEISLPDSSRFFVAKEYIVNVGSPDLLAQQAERRRELDAALEEACAFAKDELDKPFEEMTFQTIEEKYLAVVENFSDFETEVQEAKDLLVLAQDAYLQKKILFLEEKAQAATGWQESSMDPHAEIHEFHQAAAAYDSSSDENMAVEILHDGEYVAQARASGHGHTRMVAWEPVEDRYFREWSNKTGINDRREFYRDEELSSVRLNGVIEPYDRPVKNKPGNFILRNPATNVPQAYLYSTTVDLTECIGKERSLVVVERPNHHFAFPAYFVLSAE